MNEPIVARVDAHDTEEGPTPAPSPNRNAHHEARVGSGCPARRLVRFPLPCLRRRHAGYADAEPLGTADGYVWASECNIPTGTTDAAPAIENCMDQLGSGSAGGTLFLGKGPYTLATPVDVNTGPRTRVVLQGAGNAYNGATAFNVTSGHDGFVIDTGGSP